MAMLDQEDRRNEFVYPGAGKIGYGNSKCESFVTSGIIRFAHIALESDQLVPRDFIVIDEYWEWIEIARELARVPGNVTKDGEISFEAWKLRLGTKDRDRLIRFDQLYRDAHDVLPYRYYTYGVQNCREFAVKRLLRNLLGEFTDELDQRNGDIPRYLEMIDEIKTLANKATAAEAWKDMVFRYTDLIEQRYVSRREPTIVSVGLPSIDSALGKIIGGRLIVISSEAKKGKTTLAYQLIDYSCARLGTPTALFTLEMTKEEVLDRLVARNTRIDSMRLKSGDLLDTDLAKVSAALVAYQKLPFVCLDSNRQTADTLENQIRYQVATKKTKLVIIDYVQLLESDLRARRFEQLEQISLRLARIAKELNVVVVAISQLNEAGNTAGSRQLEKDCSALIKIYPDKEDPETVYVDLHMNRHGPSRRVKTRFEGNVHIFKELTDRRDDAPRSVKQPCADA
jgi:replicative DNA helicase